MKLFPLDTAAVLFLILLGAVFCLLPGCAAPPAGNGGGEDPTQAEEFGPKAPDWVKSGKLAYPKDQFITGLGYSDLALPEADAYDQAKLGAFTDISTQIETFVENEFVAIQKSVYHNENQDDFVDLQSVSRQVTKELLAGVEVVKRYYDSERGVACVAAVMDRLKLCERLLKQAEDARVALTGNLEAYDKAAADRDWVQGLKCLIHAHRCMDQIIGAHLKTIAVGAPQRIHDRFEKLNDPALAATIVRDLGGITDRIRIVPVAGNEQKALLTGLLREPITVKVLFGGDQGDLPLADFPMTVVVADASKAQAVPHGSGTDKAGIFSFDLRELKATGSASNTVLVQLNFRAVEDRSSLSPPSLEITYFLPTRETTRVGVMIRETIDGEVNPSPHTGSAIKDALTEIGFQVIRLEQEVPLEKALGMSHKELMDQFGSICDYLLLGTAEAELSSNDGNFIWYRTRIVLDALELESGKTIHFEVPMNDDTKGGNITKSKAIRKSLANAAEVLVGDPGGKKTGLLTKKFISRFEEGAEWVE